MCFYEFKLANAMLLLLPKMNLNSGDLREVVTISRKYCDRTPVHISTPKNGQMIG
jgi:hypothetical protein